MVNPGLYIKADTKYVLYGKIKYVVWFYKGGKRGCFILIINAILEYNPPYMQSDFTCNLGLTSLIIKFFTAETNFINRNQT